MRRLRLLLGLLVVVPAGAVVVWSIASDSEKPVSVGGWPMLAFVLGPPALMLLAAADVEMLVGPSRWWMLAFFLIVPTFLLLAATSAYWRGNGWWQLTRAWRKQSAFPAGHVVLPTRRRRPR